MADTMAPEAWQSRLALLAEGHCPVGHGHLTQETRRAKFGVRAGQDIQVGFCAACNHAWRLRTMENVGLVVEHYAAEGTGCEAGVARFMLSEPFPWDHGTYTQETTE